MLAHNLNTAFLVLHNVIQVGALLYCTALYCTALHCTALHCTVLHCNALYCTVLHYTALPCTALYCIALPCPALHYTALPCPALHCTALYNTALYLNHWSQVNFSPAANTVTRRSLHLNTYFCQYILLRSLLDKLFYKASW